MASPNNSRKGSFFSNNAYLNSIVYCGMKQTTSLSAFLLDTQVISHITHHTNNITLNFFFSIPCNILFESLCQAHFKSALNLIINAQLLLVHPITIHFLMLTFRSIVTFFACFSSLFTLSRNFGYNFFLISSLVLLTFSIIFS